MLSLRSQLERLLTGRIAVDPRLDARRWRADEGEGRTVALIDASPADGIEDLEGASIEARDFAADRSCPPAAAIEHTTHGACLLVGQGRLAVRGLVPRARLLIASVWDSGDRAAPAAIAAAIEWAADAGASVIVLPIGDHVEHPPITAAIIIARRRGVTIVAAAGNAHPRPLLFPARLAEVLAIGATDLRGALLDECCRGPGLDLSLPAHRVCAPIGPGRIAARSGTSVAAALAGGALTLAS